eukprot:SAG22_NODE_19788_length_271_cov_1.087209_1_plen_54_part_01
MQLSASAPCCPFAYSCLPNKHLSCQVSRIETVIRSPLYTHFGEALKGCTTIRAF